MGMGYQGYAKFFKTGPSTSPLIVLATGASVNTVLEPIISNSVWGAGWYNAAVAHYADAALRYEGSIAFELQGDSDLWDFLGNWIVNERAYPRSLEISPDGARVYHYLTTGAYDANYDLNGAWNSSATFSTSAGSFVTVDAGVVALNRSQTDPAGTQNYTNYSYILQKTGVIASDCSLLATTNPLNPGGNNVDPIPFWRTNANLFRGTYTTPFNVDMANSPQTGLETVEWNVGVEQNHVVLYTCSGSRLPTAYLQGTMEPTGAVTLYNPDGVFDPILGPSTGYSITSPYMYAQNTWFVVQIARGSAGATIYMELPAVLLTSDTYDIAGMNDVTNRAFNIRGLGGRCNGTVTMPPFIMSDSSGAFVAP